MHNIPLQNYWYKMQTICFLFVFALFTFKTVLFCPVNIQNFSPKFHIIKIVMRSIWVLCPTFSYWVFFFFFFFFNILVERIASHIHIPRISQNFREFFSNFTSNFPYSCTKFSVTFSKIFQNIYKKPTNFFSKTFKTTHH